MKVLLIEMCDIGVIDKKESFTLSHHHWCHYYGLSHITTIPHNHHPLRPLLWLLLILHYLCHDYHSTTLWVPSSLLSLSLLLSLFLLVSPLALLLLLPPLLYDYSCYLYHYHHIYIFKKIDYICYGEKILLVSC